MSYDVQQDWAIALAMLSTEVDRADLRRVAYQTELMQQSAPSVYGAIFRYVPPRGHDGRLAQVEVLLNTRLASCHGPERVELLLWVAAVSYYHHRTGLVWDHLSPSEDLYRLCRKIGCACTAIFEPSVRWLNLGMHSKINPRLVELSGGWPSICPVCERPVHSDERDPRVHENCRNYARIIYVSAAEAKRREEAQHNAADLDR